MKRPDTPQPPWQRGHFAETDQDPLTGFANLMDVMLVFALGLMLALVAQSPELRQRLQLDPKREVSEGRELTDPPESMRQMVNGQGTGMEPLGQVYRDPKSGKLILISQP